MSNIYKNSNKAWIDNLDVSEWLGQDRKYSQTVANSVHEELHPHAAVLSPGEVPPQHGEVLLVDVADGGVKGIMEDHQL